MNGPLLLFLAALTTAAGYALACWRWPYANCRRCHGTGKRHSPTGEHYRRCRRCAATGERVRVGRRLYDRLHTTR